MGIFEESFSKKLIIEYLSYYQKLCFVDQLDHNDLEKLFHYNDLYPSASELKEAKEQVLKCNIRFYLWNFKLIITLII